MIHMCECPSCNEWSELDNCDYRASVILAKKVFFDVICGRKHSFLMQKQFLHDRFFCPHCGYMATIDQCDKVTCYTKNELSTRRFPSKTNIDRQFAW